MKHSILSKIGFIFLIVLTFDFSSCKKEKEYTLEEIEELMNS